MAHQAIGAPPYKHKLCAEQHQHQKEREERRRAEEGKTEEEEGRRQEVGEGDSERRRTWRVMTDAGRYHEPLAALWFCELTALGRFKYQLSILKGRKPNASRKNKQNRGDDKTALAGLNTAHRAYYALFSSRRTCALLRKRPRSMPRAFVLAKAARTTLLL